MLERVRAQCGDIGTFKLGPREVIVSSSPEHARIVLLDEADAFEKGPTVRKFARPVLGDGLIPCANADHRRRRALVAPAFRHRQLQHYAGVFGAETRAACDRWAESSHLDLAPAMMQLTLRIVGRTLFDVDLESQAKDVGDALTVVLSYVTELIQNPVAPPLSVPTARNRKVNRAIEMLDQTIGTMVEDRRRSEDKEATDLLSSLVFAVDEDGSTLSDREIRDEVMNLVLAGHETTANALTWAWVLLIQHPDVAARLRDEVDALESDEIDAAAASQLVLTQQILQEAMRLYPPVHSLGRQAQRRVRLGRYELEAGAIVIVSTYLLHRREDLFDRPLTFDPSRFAPDLVAARPRFTYLPFGGGPRVCVGAQFAMLETQIVLATMARRLDLMSLEDRVEPEMLITLRPRGDVRCSIRPR